MSGILLEGVIEAAVQPVEVGNSTQLEGHLRVIIEVVAVMGMDRINSLVGIEVDNLVSKVVMGLLPEVL